ncbi:TIM barrel protein [Actinoallomurus soli]|uniref:TIM barrel protein n=1 Tax=Actinoallomurus soli TaxID=2952535 RepID=UPI002092F354|nr:TIM barrel protein [Actinoallomurus soli]MCO5972344.1 TIM barrel protein [Actinoallomurus soli]
MTALWAADAGGTTTTAIHPGTHAITTYGPINPASTGPDTADRTLRTLLHDIARSLDGAPATGWLATATVDLTDPGTEPDRLRRLARDAGLRGHLLLSNDALPWLVAPPLGGRGVALVCGTGTGFIAAGDHPRLARTGGCEYLGSDEGSAYDLGIAGLRAAVRADDGRGPATTIGARLTAAHGHTPAELARRLAATAFPKAAIAALAPAVTAAWLDGDEVATALITAALDELVLGVRAARDRAGLTGPLTVAAGGGVLRECPPLRTELDRRLRTELDAGHVIPVTEPVATVHAALHHTLSDGPPRPPDGPAGTATWLIDLDPPPHRTPQPPPPHPRTGDPQITIGLCLAAWGGTDLTTALQHATHIGVHTVDLPTDTTTGLLDLTRWSHDPDYRADLRTALTGVTVGCVSNSRDTQLLLGPHGPHTDPVLHGTPQAKHDHALRHAQDTIRLAADLGAPHARLMLGVPDLTRWLSWWHSTVTWDDNITAWCEHAHPILTLAAEHGITLLIEPHPKQVAYDRTSTRRLLDAAARTEPRATVQICLDPANLAATGHDPVDAVRGWGTDLGAAHAKDLQRHTTAHPPTGTGWSRYGPGPAIRFRALGAGDLPWPAIVAALLDEDFHGVLYVEHEDALLPREQSVHVSTRLLRDLLPQHAPQGRTW